MSNIQTTCIKEHFFDKCSNLDLKLSALKDIWRNLDGETQMYAFEFIMGVPGLNCDILSEEHTERVAFRLKALRQLIKYNGCYSYYDENNHRLLLFSKMSGYYIEWAGCGLIAKYQDDDDIIPLNTFKEVLLEVDKMHMSKKRKLANDQGDQDDQGDQE